ncbi:aldo/keto reductase [Limibacter armeniacum]|uniref:aldo/keto reductase n=1 Tax=Limibacter armeniacum TaxID=466084 RepID=UPI002FE50BE5
MKVHNLRGTFTLHNGIEMPALGLGVFKAEDGEEVIQSVKWALEHGYRSIDTASIYQNEEGVGEGMRQSGVKREEIFLTSKVWNADQGYNSTLTAFDESLERLGTDYLDLYLVHWPVKGKFTETWRAMESLYKDGRIRAIGVSNFLRHQLEEVMDNAQVIPMVNQIEFHPYLQSPRLVEFCEHHRIQLEAWAPLMQGAAFEVKELVALADKYKKTVPQIVLRWNLQRGIVTIPKSVKEERIISNAAIFDFELTEADMEQINLLDRGRRIGPDPDNFDF